MPGNLYDVVATGAGDAWAVGDEDDGAVVMRWRGEAWTKVEVPRRLGLHGLRVVAASGPSDVWVFGAGGPSSGQEARAARWHGTQWTSTWREPNSFVDAATIAGPDHVWVAARRTGGDGTCRSVLRHHTSAGWPAVALPSVVCVQAMHALASQDVWAVGEARGRPATLHWDGQKWRTVSLPPAVAGPNGELRGLAAQSPTQVWAVGRTGRMGGAVGPVAVRWDGRKWESVVDPTVPGKFVDAAADGHDGVLVSASSASGDDLVFHYDGRQWSWEHVASDHSVTGLTVIPDTSRIVAVGICCEGYDEDTTGKIWMRH
ncbi:hypothetical protein [Streptomyces longispororuber]|uniref:hypothetical protein n=1 Tax=Streptomyces longispororuber TaxID=68230 RepID=UPI00210ED189|nr:hypothetical protein [Streptomyces longispororuber]MCQ4211510.1 hypothetical protein [Streptomyces longispororuber]